MRQYAYTNNKQNVTYPSTRPYLNRLMKFKQLYHAVETLPLYNNTNKKKCLSMSQYSNDTNVKDVSYLLTIQY